MITMKKLGVVVEVPTEEKAALLERQGFKRMGGAAELAPNRFATMKDIQTATDSIYAHMNESLQKMGEAMYERLYHALAEAAHEKPKAAKASKKEEPHGGADQPDSTDGAK